MKPAIAKPILMDKKPTAPLDENAQLRGDLLAIASRINHDFRTPLGGIISAGGALKEMLADHGLPDVLVDSIIHSAEELSGLIRRVSFVLKATAKPVPKEPVDMGQIVFTIPQKVELQAVKRQASVTA